jgi:hypothetical protein
MGFAFLIPIAKIALRAILGEVLNSEKIFGAGRGDEKLEAASDGVGAELANAFGLEKVANALDEIRALIVAVVDVLNALGMLDEEPGLDVDYGKLIPALKVAFSAVADLVEALQ